MLVSRYAGLTWAWQVFGLWILGAIAASAAARLGADPIVVWTAAAGFGGAGLFVLSFYRDPERTPPDDPAAWVSPADGVVTDIGVVDEPMVLKAKALRVGIFLSPLNVHVNRVPHEGEVEAVAWKEGVCQPATSPACIDVNAAAIVGLRTPAGQRYAVRQVTGALARTIVCPVKAGERYARGQRYGMIKLGSRTELLLPVEAGFEPAVKVGDVVRGGATTIGRLPAVPALPTGAGAKKSQETA
jgi:phosphatidylserine decarboxylase